MEIYCCGDLMDMTINAENGNIEMCCGRCEHKKKYNILDKFKICNHIDKYTCAIKSNKMYFEDYTPIKMVVITGTKLDGSLEIVETDVSKESYYEVIRDVFKIRNLKDTSVILGDDAPTLYLPFEEEGLACHKMEVEIIY